MTGNSGHRDSGADDARITRKNTIAFIADGASFSVGGAFLEANTVLPTFVATLTDSAFLIGLVSAVRNFGYLIPQIFVAGLIERLPTKKAFMMKAGQMMRISALCLALSALISRTAPTLALWVFFVSLTAYALADGFGGLPWLDIVAKTIPQENRAGLFGRMQATGGVAAFFAGFVVQALIQHNANYPMNYFWVMFMGTLFMGVSLVAMSFIVDPGGKAPKETVPMLEYLRRLPLAVKGHRVFRNVLITRVLLGSLYLALPFFAIHAQAVLGFPQSVVGLFVSAQMVGSVVGGPFLGYLGDRHGAYKVVRMVAIMAAATGFLALAARFVFFLGNRVLTYVLYFLLYLSLGGVLSGIWIGFNNYIMDIAPQQNRATFLGVFNTIAAPLTLLSLLGGWVLGTFDYSVLFAVMSGVQVLTCIVAWRLPDSRDFVT